MPWKNCMPANGAGGENVKDAEVGRFAKWRHEFGDESSIIVWKGQVPEYHPIETTKYIGNVPKAKPKAKACCP